MAEKPKTRSYYTPSKIFRVTVSDDDNTFLLSIRTSATSSTGSTIPANEVFALRDLLTEVIEQEGWAGDDLPRTPLKEQNEHT